MMFLLGVTVFLARVTDLEASFLKSAVPGACIGGIYTKGIYTSNTCFEDTYSEAGTCFKNAWIGDTGAAGTRHT